ncbi:major facilitator superfamily (MFS) transporter [Legionella birminghamensis]|uniref:Major facilitator superfamily (MFS) transporter n=1 Tax=Legionella birminghamensis TaxID=28083 RepID=A0A378IAS3_9GAMM|nr:MFS transporter [Legionella birminghamensis]KTC75184.1 major facilitator superfamily (MFS) transporter [Legionella birminghamensis]STX31865.1 major facilitator superfamily (MFS) transporter [Legionella birminghamensis]
MPASRVIAWTIWIISSIFYAYQYILRVMPNVMLNDIIQQFHIDAAVFGQFSGVYYIGYSLMHLPIGIMLDRFGPRKVMTGCILMTVVGLLPILFAKYWVYPILGRALIGMGSSAAILGTFKIIRMSFSEQRFTRMLSFSVTIGLLGAIYGGGPLSYLSSTLGYQAVVQIFIYFGLLLALLTYLIVPEMETSHFGSIADDVKSVFTNRKVLLLCLSAGLMVGPLEGFTDVWGSGFLREVYGFNTVAASYLPSMIFVGMCFGGPTLSFIAERKGKYLTVIISAGIVMALSFIALVSRMLSIDSMAIVFVVVGICCAYQILAIYKASTYVPDQVAGLTTAVANMIIMSFGYAFHTTIGLVINAFGGTKVPQAFLYGITVIPFTLCLGIIGFCLIQISDKKAKRIVLEKV